MKKNFKILLTTGLVLTALFSLCMSAGAINVVVNGENITMTQPPIMHNNRVMVPVRDAFEALGVAVFYEQDMVNCVTRDSTIIIPTYWEYENYYLYYINGEKVESNQSPINYNGKIMVPIRMIAEAFGASVNWDKQSETVTLAGTIREDVRLSKAEIDAAHAFTLDKARKKAVNSDYYEPFGAYYIYPSFSKGVKSYNFINIDSKGMGTGRLKISIDGEVSYESLDRTGENIKDGQ